MIGNITKGNNGAFKAMIKYALQESKGYLLDTNIPVVNLRDANEYNDFIQLNNRSRPDTRKPAFHLSISVDKDDYVDDNTLRDISIEYLSKLGFAVKQSDEFSNPYLIVRHVDTDHQHVHTIASTIRSDGKLLDLHNDFRRTMLISRDLEKKYGFRIVSSFSLKEEKSVGKREKEKTNRLKKNNFKYISPRKYLIQNIEAAMQPIGGGKRMFRLFVNELKERQIEMNINASKDLQRINGVSFSLIRNGEKIVYKGSSLGKKFTWNRICQNVDFKLSRDQELIQSIVSKSNKNKTVPLSSEEKKTIYMDLRRNLSTCSKKMNIKVFNSEYRLSKLDLSETQLRYLNQLNKEWEGGNYKNNPIKYFENVWKRHRYENHLSNIKSHKALSAANQDKSRALSSELKYQFNNLLKGELEKQGLRYTPNLKNKINALSLNNNDNKELSGLMDKWQLNPAEANTTPMDYFFEHFSLHKEHYEKQLEESLKRMDGSYGIDSSANLKELINLGGKTNYNSKVPLALIAYENMVQEGHEQNIVRFVKNYITDKDKFQTGHQDSVYATGKQAHNLNVLLEDLAKGTNIDGAGAYREEPQKKRRKGRRIN
ncbi:relaxase/mobilization nuclease domain-containing protein [Marinifilum fragile]|uniref:relaxase/mobilization nuclease domain-containing protein n=1 Tax=Marinifilum fragile TaxID=570161 RepID=UPI002AAC251D|nr:relaxase/mobilization nuclease domain-containing protein [Marinifilum fragile]